MTVRTLTAPRSMNTMANAMSSHRAPVTGACTQSGRSATNNPIANIATPRTSVTTLRPELTLTVVDCHLLAANRLRHPDASAASGGPAFTRLQQQLPQRGFLGFGG